MSGAKWAALALSVFVLGACGGGDSSITTVSGAGLSALGSSPPVALSPFVQKSNNLKVEVNGGPVRSFAAPSANILYADVKICVPGNAAQCVTVPHVQVDTGSVGLRVLASKVASLSLPVVALPGSKEAWECYPFVVGGLWGRNAVADVTLGNQEAISVPIQLVQDGVGPQATEDCAHASGGTLQANGTYSREGILDSVDRLGSNGILGIGNTELDCAQMCINGVYTSFVMYYGCPVGATSSGGCAATGIQANLQVYNPVAAFTLHNNGVVLALPAVSFPGAATATGELIFGIDTSASDPGATNNVRPLSATPVLLGTNASNRSYLNVTTAYSGLNVTNSYLDTGTNGLFFSDNSSPMIALCAGNTWYCPFNSLPKAAIICDGDNRNLPQIPLPFCDVSNSLQSKVAVSFTIDNAEAVFSTTNTAFAGLAGAPSGVGTTFAWGLPFFYGRRVFLSIWQPSKAGGPSSPPCSPGKPCYAWETL
jgi:hypothetical protein